MGFVVVDGEMRPPDLTRDEWYRRDKASILDTRHEQVEAFCIHRQIAAPTLSDWRNAQEVLTFFVRRRDDRGIEVTRRDIAENAFYPDKVAPVTVTRALAVLRDLALVGSRRCKAATAYTIDWDRLAEIQATPLGPIDAAYTASSRDASSANHLGSMEVSSRTPNDAQIITRCAANDASSIYSLSDSAPTTTDDAFWPLVVVEVKSCGVNQARAAANAARMLGATPADVQSIVEEWRTRKPGWAYAVQNLYRRLCSFDPQQAPADGWPPFDPAYQAELDRQATLAETRAYDARTRRRQLTIRRERRRRRYEMAVDQLYLPSIIELAAARDPRLAAGAEQAAKRKSIEEKKRARTLERLHELRSHLTGGEVASTNAAASERLANWWRIVEREAAAAANEQQDLQPRPPPEA